MLTSLRTGSSESSFNFALEQSILVSLKRTGLRVVVMILPWKNTAQRASCITTFTSGNVGNNIILENNTINIILGYNKNNKINIILETNGNQRTATTNSSYIP